jgi:hypothetical protein
MVRNLTNKSVMLGADNIKEVLSFQQVALMTGQRAWQE